MANKQTRLFDVLEEIRASEFPHLPPALVKSILELHLGSLRDKSPLADTRKLVEARIGEVETLDD